MRDLVLYQDNNSLIIKLARVCPILFCKKCQGLFQDFSKTQIYFSRTPNFTSNSIILKISKSTLLTVNIY